MVENRIYDGDIRGAARLLFSNDTLASNSSETLSALASKHPPAAAGLCLPASPDDSCTFLSVLPDDVLFSINSFQSGSAGGLDGLSPQHLKDLTGCGESGEGLIRAITSLVNKMLSGQVSTEIIDILYGANLCALLKKDGGIRPIAVGTTYRRLAAKVCCRIKSSELRSKFQPTQLGFGSRGGCEAAVHSLRSFVSCHTNDILLKVDVKNAFNSVDRGALLTQIKDKLPDVYPFLWQCYGSPTKLIYKDKLLSSEVGCQQGDPLGPAIFSLVIHPIIKRLESKFNVWYLDDGTLGGEANTILKDLKFLIEEFKLIGLELNFGKCELYIPETETPSTISCIKSCFQSLVPNFKLIDKSSLCLLGSPILDEALPNFINDKIQNFLSVSDKLNHINVHVAFVILRFCLFVPKFTYYLRCSQLWKYPQLTQQLDSIMRDTLVNIFNIPLDDRAWDQATLPIRLGGLGIRKISCISLPAFLSSVHGTKDLIHNILGKCSQNFEITGFNEAIGSWKIACPDTNLPKALFSQRLWDEPLCELIRKNLLNTSINSAERARLLAVSEWESGLWLHVLPSKNLGTLLDKNSFRVATSLRLGCPCLVAHRCQCGETVDKFGHHALACVSSAGRVSRHNSINDIIRRAFTSVSVAATLEPRGLMRDDGKRPDGMTLIPWKMGRPLVWDATCVDTLAPSHLAGTSVRAGSAATSAESLKRRKYVNLDRGYLFEPFGVETLGPWGPGAHEIYKDLSKLLIESTGDQNAGFYFGQRISIAIQRGNAASILGTLPNGDGLNFL